ncbi:peroxisome biogenesis factor 1-like isoform X2 [Homarus americanus]|uniref:peroxisome biogenesis factor 1-like isoform X2 n=1 Tax=Homarus americanus TaxID=6706 RepID=UPI001C469244|nr:peroxisome biogenesis factor 1-like isoform X2 [Homarus americanus]
MGRTLDADSYFPCLKCNIWVPNYAKEIHTAECHELGLLSFSHPYVVGSSLYGQIITTGAVQTSLQEKERRKIKSKEVKERGSGNREKKNSKKGKDEGTERNKEGDKSSQENSELDGNKTILEEPDWLKKIFYGFHYRIVLMNERDLIRCNVCAYSPVEVKCGSNSCAFLAIPDETVRIGHVTLHHKSCLQYLPALTHNKFLWIKKITNIVYADEVLVTPSKVLIEKECSFMEQQLKCLLFSNYPLGAPFTLNIGSKVYLPSTCNTDNSFTLNNYSLCKVYGEDSLTKEDSLIENLQNLDISSRDSDDSVLGRSESIPSELLTLDECVGSETSLTDCSPRPYLSGSDTSSAFVTLDEIRTGDSMEVSNLESDMLTSTPKKSNENKKNIYKSLLTSKVYNKDISTIQNDKSETGATDGSQQCSRWIRIGRDTKVIVQRLYSTVTKDSPEVKLQQETYCKDTAYVTLLKIMQIKLKDSVFANNPLLGGWGGVLVYGPPGTGKTLMVHQAAEEMNVPVVTLTLNDITRSSGGGDQCVRQRFKLASESAPSVLFLDEVESLCPAGEHKAQGNRDLIPAIVQGIHTLQTSSEPVLLVAATSRPDGITSKLRCSGRLNRELMVPLPDAQQRLNILHQLLSSHYHRLGKEEVTEVAKRAYGFSGADLNVLLRCSWLSCVERLDKERTEELSLSKEDLLYGLKSIVPTMLRQNYSAVSTVRWSDIWGYQTVRSKLQTMIQLHINEPEEHPLRGVLFYGPPGCSKTMFVRALVHETSFSFFPLKCSDLLSKFVGETEKSLSKVFSRARQAAPAIIFMDEVDSLCGDRGGGGGLVSELLSLMAQTAPYGNIMIIGATNRPHAIDEALLRPGCLEQVIHIDLPDFKSRCEIWKGILEDVPLKGQVDIEKLSEATAGYSGAEITAIYQEAAHTAITELTVQDIEQTESTQDSQECVAISEELLLKVAKSVPSRTPASLLEAINQFTSQRRHKNFK